MLKTSFEIDIWALLLAGLAIAAVVGLLRWKSTFAMPQIFISEYKALTNQFVSWKVRWSKIPQYLMYAALGLFILAFVDPHLQLPRQGPAETIIPTEGIAIYLLADISSSMNEKTSSRASRAASGKLTKIELLKKVAADFVLGNPSVGLTGRPQDAIGLVTFARVANVVVPTTQDHAEVAQAISELQTVKDKTQDGTALGYAIFKGVNLLDAESNFAKQTKNQEKPAIDILSKVLVVITDGFQEINPKDIGNPLRDKSLEQAAAYAKEKNVRLYVVNVEPAFSSEEFLPHRHLMERITGLTGGQFYHIQDTTHLDQIYAALNKLQKSIIPSNQQDLQELSKDQQPHRYRRMSIYPYLIGAGMVLLFLSILMKTIVLRQIP